jgi:flagellar hook-basal body complex protein FliE
MEIPAISMRVPDLTTPSVNKKPDIAAPASADNGSSAGGGFGQALSSAITNLNETQNAADDASVRMAAGDPIDLHEVMLARETASLHFQLAVQVRNKLVEAYQETMRMQV